jgi:hypothetical protein
MDRITERGDKWIAEIHVTPSKRRRMQNAPSYRIHHSGHCDAYPFNRSDILMLGQ